ncbi:hypothetical protein [Bacillus safensis]|uniref:hypothetical protein n=1 Tax=Bacillus safensis TaxID=561879 RepID=UPI003982BE75
MSWLEFFSSILTSGSLATIIVVLILKKPLTVILSRVGNLLSFKYKDVLHLDFAKGLDEVEQNESVIDSQQNETTVTETSGNLDIANNAEDKAHREYVYYYERLAKESPDQAVYSVWLDLEAELKYSIVRLGGNTLRDIPELVRSLLYNENISHTTANNILLMWNLRNDIAKSPDAVFLDSKEAIRYCTLAHNLIKQLRKINGDYYMNGKLSD